MSEEDSDDKQFEASQKKLDDARKRGEVPRAQDLLTSGTYFGFIIASLLFGPTAIGEIGTFMSAFFDRPEAITALLFNGSGAAAVNATILLAAGKFLAPWIAVPALCVISILVVTRSFVFSATKIQPKLSKISPLKNAQNKFGRTGLFEFAKSFSKLSIYSVILGVFITLNLPEIIQSGALEPAIVIAKIPNYILEFLLIVFAISLFIGGIDYLFQYTEHMRKNRMSYKEMTDETKEQEGDPHAKQKRRQRAQEIATNKMLSDVPNADVIIVNPTHYAVALSWNRMSGGAPVCVAKGMDEIAARIREIATENNVPIHRDVQTARALHATVEVGHEILPEHYKAVAAAIRFAETMRQKMRDQIGR